MQNNFRWYYVPNWPALEVPMAWYAKSIEPMKNIDKVRATQTFFSRTSVLLAAHEPLQESKIDVRFFLQEDTAIWVAFIYYVDFRPPQTWTAGGGGGKWKKKWARATFPLLYAVESEQSLLSMSIDYCTNKCSMERAPRFTWKGLNINA